MRLFVTSLVAVAALTACGADSTIVPGPDRVASASGTDSSSQTPTGTDTAHTPPPPTSNGPVASVSLSPKQVTLPMGYYAHLVARALDAKGILVAGKRAQWRSSDLAVAVPSDTGVIYAKGLGTAKIYATVDAHTDSATITVIAAAPPPPPPVDTSTVPPAAASFSLTVTAVGVVPGADTSRVEPVAGTVITLTRVMGIAGDSLSPGVVVGTATADAAGVARFKNVPGGYYTILATPPAGSPYQKSTTGIAPPRTSEVSVRVTMRR